MRADRLLSLLMLLQARGRMTAGDLAHELEVSVRTIYRDLDALTLAGVPIIADRGPGGGCALRAGYRTTLTGLTEDEVRALFMLSIPTALTELGVGGRLKAALLKLNAALPGDHRDCEAWVRQRIHLDWSVEPISREPVRHLATAQGAVWSDRRLFIAYRLKHGSYRHLFERLVDPYGLVSKGGAWFLVCRGDGAMRVYDLGRLSHTSLSDQRFGRPTDFDLAAFWSTWSARNSERFARLHVTVRVDPSAAAELQRRFGPDTQERIADAESDAGGRITLDLSFESLDAARRTLLGYGRAVEVLAPVALRRTVADFATQIVALYDV